MREYACDEIGDRDIEELKNEMRPLLGDADAYVAEAAAGNLCRAVGQSARREDCPAGFHTTGVAGPRPAVDRGPGGSSSAVSRPGELIVSRAPFSRASACLRAASTLARARHGRGERFG